MPIETISPDTGDMLTRFCATPARPLLILGYDADARELVIVAVAGMTDAAVTDVLRRAAELVEVPAPCDG